MLKNPYLQGFDKLFGRVRKATALKWKDSVEQIRKLSPGQLPLLFCEWVEPEKIPLRENERDRFFNTRVTFWAMLWQAFTDGSLRDSVRVVQASRALQEELPSNATGSYSDARKRLDLSTLEDINARLVTAHAPACSLLGERRIWVVDSTGVQIEDTAANQAEYPQPSNQKEGCGFPVLQVTALFNLNNAYLQHHCCSAMDAGEGGMFDSELAEHLESGDVLVADRLFCSYCRIAELKQRDIDVIMRLHCSKQWPSAAKGDDVVVQWKRPRLSAAPAHLTDEQWAKLPEHISIRYIRKRIERKGFRDQQIIIVTTIMDQSAQCLLEIYARRWDIELCFDDIKTTMGMDFIRAKSPEMALKMIQIYAIAYNLIRLTMNKAANITKHAVNRLSFKGALDSILRFSAQIAATTLRKRSAVIRKLLEIVGNDLLPNRPNRLEPRVRKGRPKCFPLMVKPRSQLRDEILKQMCA